MNILTIVKLNINSIADFLQINQDISSNASLEIPKDIKNGELSTNIAMLAAPILKLKPFEIANRFKEHLLKIDVIKDVTIAGPGFINITLEQNAWQQQIPFIIESSSEFYRINTGNNRKINVEYVSANPTGPMHIGHARIAVYGDAIANILKFVGYDVVKEFYVNDAGAQVKTLVDSVILRCEEIISGIRVDIPNGLYPGAYLIDIAHQLISKFGQNLLSIQNYHKIIKDFVISAILAIIKDDLQDLGIEHDVFFSEQTLHDQNKIMQVIGILTKMALIYEGELAAPKGHEDPNWQARSQLLFKATDYGDDVDRPIVKADGTWTYLAAELAYVKNKIDRGFEHLVLVLGADHSGYVKRIEAVTKALGQGRVKSSIKICQLVNFVKNGQQVKMSKRNGEFLTTKDVNDEVGKDIVRFMMLSRRNDMPIEFDFEKVKEQSKENPVFYVQYAYVRTISIINNASEQINEAVKKLYADDYDVSLLILESEIALVRSLCQFPNIVIAAAKNLEPHRVIYYLSTLSAEFHAIWNLSLGNNKYRFVVNNDLKLTAARLSLVLAVQKILESSFKLLGITPLEEM